MVRSSFAGRRSFLKPFQNLRSRFNAVPEGSKALLGHLGAFLGAVQGGLEAF